jgi:hypothetical protein
MKFTKTDMINYADWVKLNTRTIGKSGYLYYRLESDIRNDKYCGYDGISRPLPEYTSAQLFEYYLSKVNVRS